MTNPLGFGSCFSGIGGFELGFERAGMRCEWQCEMDRHCWDVLTRTFPHPAIYDDINTLIDHEPSSIQVLCGGSPCQDFSLAGPREGLAGERSGLFYRFAGAIDHLKPKWIVLENVVGILSANGGRDMGTVLGTLGELGYGWTYRVLNARHFGVPQSRRRIVIVGRAGGYCPPEVLHEPDSLLRRSEERRGERTIVSSPYQECVGEAKPVTFDWTAAGASDSSFKHKSRQWVVDKPGRTRTLCASKNLAVVVGGRVRYLTMVERERLMGFPDNHTAGFSDETRTKMTGNAFPPPMAEWVGRRLVACDAGLDPNYLTLEG